MAGSSPMGVLFALVWIMVLCGAGMGVLWLCERAGLFRPGPRYVDRCGDCRRVLRYDERTGRYRPHRCHPPY